MNNWKLVDTVFSLLEGYQLITLGLRSYENKRTRLLFAETIIL